MEVTTCNNINISNATVNYTSLQYGGVLNVKCIEGFFFPDLMSQSGNAMCIPDTQSSTAGEWQPIPPSHCQGIHKLLYRLAYF